MKQIVQNLKTGKTILEDIPAPIVRRGSVLIQTSRSLVSLGTERMLVEFGRASLLQKARQQPEKVKQVLEKVRSEGLLPTIDAVVNRLEEPLPLGYCNVGRVIAIGEKVTSLKVGDRVVSNGPHAEIVNVPENLTALVPENVTDDEAAFTIIGSIGLQGIRLCAPQLGETIVVMGLGLIGLLTAQLLLANGCHVIGIDLDPNKLRIAESQGIQTVNPRGGVDVVKSVLEATKEVGADGVIITASSNSNDIISQAAKMSRKRGRIVLVGVIGLNINRSDFYEKELTFQVSCSYGPGRYDDNYEQNGQDYPLPYVRWTEKRNFEAILQALSAGKLKVKELITDKVPFKEYYKVYDNISSGDSIASILEYSDGGDLSPTINILPSSVGLSSEARIGIIGAGNFTKMTMLPALKKAKANLYCIVSASGVSGSSLARKYQINKSSTDYLEVINDPNIDLVIITTRHNQHAQMVVAGLKAKKHVFVEKPLALNAAELDEIIDAHNGCNLLTVGFNRRFSPHIKKIKESIGDAPMNVIATMNAGYISPDSWVHDMNVGGGRIVGEACHLIDLITFITGSKVRSVCMNSLGTESVDNTDNASILLSYENGSTGVVNYFANGSKAYSKERVEVYSQGKTIIMDNFRVTEGFGFKRFRKLKTRLDKGHQEQFRLLVERLKSGGEAIIPLDEIVNTTKVSFAALESLRTRQWVRVDSLT